jgi:hypothetical protein
MSEIVHSIWVEMKNRNPIGVNMYAPTVKAASDLLDEIAEGIYVLDSRSVDSSGFTFFVDFFLGLAGFCLDSGRYLSTTSTI